MSSVTGGVWVRVRGLARSSARVDGISRKKGVLELTGVLNERLTSLRETRMYDRVVANVQGSRDVESGNFVY